MKAYGLYSDSEFYPLGEKYPWARSLEKKRIREDRTLKEMDLINCIFGFIKSVNINQNYVNSAIILKTPL
jgi:hypothetical protein